METYRILISDFDEELRTTDITWVGRRFKWGTGCEWIPASMTVYLLALVDNTRKPLVTCMALAAKHAFPEASIEVMTPEDIAQADATKY